VRLCMRLDLAQYDGLVAYNELVVQLVENNYFRSGADAIDEHTFKKVAVAQVKGRRLSEIPDVEKLQEKHPLLASSSTVALGYARKVVGEAMKDWRRRLKAKRWMQNMERDDMIAAGRLVPGSAPYGTRWSGGQPSESELGPKNGRGPNDEQSTDGVVGVFSHLLGLPEMPPSMLVEGGVSLLGWLRCNGQKRWIKIGDDFLEVWLSHTSSAADQSYKWTQWGVQRVDQDFNREEPAARVTLATRDRLSIATLTLQAYRKESEPTQADRQTHLVGFIEVLKRHLLPDAQVRDVHDHLVLIADLLDPTASQDVQAASKQKSPMRRIPSFSRRVGARARFGSPSRQRLLPPSPLTRKKTERSSVGTPQQTGSSACGGTTEPSVRFVRASPSDPHSLGLGCSCPQPQLQFQDPGMDYV